jgi:hypothetical protein
MRRAFARRVGVPPAEYRRALPATGPRGGGMSTSLFGTPCSPNSDHGGQPADRLPALRPLHRSRHHRPARGPQPRAGKRVDLRRRGGRPGPQRVRHASLVADASIAEVTAPTSSSSRAATGRAPLDHEPLLDWLRTVHETTTWTTSVCTGSSCSPRRDCWTAPRPPPTGSPAICSPRSARSRPPSAWSSTARSSPPRGYLRESTWR